MNKLFPVLTTALLLAASTGAWAASTAELTVKGLITPSACTPSLSNGGVIDHGKISAKDLNPAQYTIIGNHTLSLTVTCEAATAFALYGVDNRVGSTDNPSDYGLGLINGDQKLGHYVLMLSNPLADNVPVQTIGSTDQGSSWNKERFLDPGLYMSIAAMSDASQPLPTKDLVADLEVQTLINRTDGMDLSNEVLIDGSATLEMRYL